VAVVVTVFNKAPFVAETLRSVMRQSHQEIELIVIDDGSSDGSPDVVRQTLEDYPARLVTLTNGGVSRARNAGAAEASDEARYLLFLDADDLLAVDSVRAMVDHLEQHREAVACYGRIRYVDVAGDALPDPPDDYRWAWTRFGRRPISDNSLITPLEAVWTNFFAIPSCCLIRRSGFAATTGFDRSLCPPATRFTAEDKDIVIQLALQGEVHRLPQQLVDYRVLPSGHKDALNDGLKALNIKWWSAGLTPDHRARVRRAIRFEYRSAAADALAYFLQATRRHRKDDVITTARYLTQASLRWVLTNSRMQPSSLRAEPAESDGAERSFG
jgi:glycosyltransferase involved in cell wall biosynthesis